MLATAAGDSRYGLSRPGEPLDGFSEEAYRQVYALLGTPGRRYLGVRLGLTGSLSPGSRMVRALLRDEEDAERRVSPQPYDDFWQNEEPLDPLSVCYG